MGQGEGLAEPSAGAPGASDVNSSSRGPGGGGASERSAFTHSFLLHTCLTQTATGPMLQMKKLRAREPSDNAVALDQHPKPTALAAQRAPGRSSPGQPSEGVGRQAFPFVPWFASRARPGARGLLRAVGMGRHRPGQMCDPPACGSGAAADAPTFKGSLGEPRLAPSAPQMASGPSAPHTKPARAFCAR